MGWIQEFTGSAQKRRAGAAGGAAQQELRTGYGAAQDLLNPYLAGSADAYGRLQTGLAPGGAFGQSYPGAFNPNTFQFQADPGYQFRLNEGEGAIHRAAAAGGKALSGATLRDLARFGQNLATGEYQNAYQRALANDQRTENRFYQDQANRYGRLAALVDMQRQAAGQAGGLQTSLANALAGNYVGTADAQNAAMSAGIGRISSAIAGTATGLAGGIAGLGGPMSAMSNAAGGFANAVNGRYV